MLTHKPDKRVFILNLNFNETISDDSGYKFPCEIPLARHTFSQRKKSTRWWFDLMVPSLKMIIVFQKTKILKYSGEEAI